MKKAKFSLEVTTVRFDMVPLLINHKRLRNSCSPVSEAMTAALSTLRELST